MIVKTFWQPVKEELIYFVNVKIQKKYIVAGSTEEQLRQGPFLNKDSPYIGKACLQKHLISSQLRF